MKDALFKHTWRKLETLRLQDFRAPDQRLLKFIIKHSSTIRKVSLIGCFLGHSYLDAPLTSGLWAYVGPYLKDNLREMMEGLKKHTKLNEFLVRFEKREGTMCRPIWDESEDDDFKFWQFEEADPKGDTSLDAKGIPSGVWGENHVDHYLLNRFLQDLCPWPMICDNPDLYWDLEFATSWTKQPEWGITYEQGPETEERDYTLRTDSM